MATTAQASCASCGKPAPAYCPDCVENKDGEKLPTVYYCKKECQVTDRPKHKVQCKHREIYRAAEILQETFLAYREAAFDLPVTSVAKTGAQLEIHDSPKEVNGRQEMQDKSPLFRFPNKLVTKDADKRAILTFGSCGDATAHLHELRVKLFRGFTKTLKTVTECEITIAENHERVCRYHDKEDGTSELDSPRCMHEVIIVSSEEGATFVFDAAGAQYRQYSPVLLLKDYIKAWVCPTYNPEAARFNAHGTAFDHYQKVCDGEQREKYGEGYDFRVTIVQTEIAERMNQAVREWEENNGKRVHLLLSESQAAYETDKRSLVRYLYEEMCKFVVHWEAKPNKYSLEKPAPGGSSDKTKSSLQPGKPSPSNTEEAQMQAAQALASLKLTDDAKSISDFNSWAARLVAEQEAKGGAIFRL